MIKYSILWLLNWYRSQCDGDWEHYRRIHISTSNDPGWKVSIGLEETGLEEIPFKKFESQRTKNDWICCDKSLYEFIGSCGPQNLLELLCVFQEWAMSNQNIESYIGKPLNSEKYDISDLDWLVKWYNHLSEKGISQDGVIKFGTIDNPGWYLMINLELVQNVNRLFHSVRIDRSEFDWSYCDVKNNIFNGHGGPYNLPELINIFREWIER